MNVLDHGPLYPSTGILRYSLPEIGPKLIVTADQGIADFYFRLIPRYKNVTRQRYDAHISVVRKALPPRMELWGKHEGREVTFYYSPRICHGQIYYWLNVFSTDLEEVREELGLSVEELFTKPPDGFRKCWHLTLGNLK